MVTDFGIDLAAYAIYWTLDFCVYCGLERSPFCHWFYIGCIMDDISRGIHILIRRQIMSLRDSLYLLGVMVLMFAAGITGHWDYFGYMLDGAVIMFLYLKGKEK